MTTFGRGKLFLEMPGHTTFLGEAEGATIYDRVVRARDVRIAFRGLEIASVEAQDVLRVLGALLRRDPHYRRPSRPFFPKRRTRSMRGK